MKARGAISRNHPSWVEGHDPLALALLPACSGAALGLNGTAPPPVKGGSY
ncbi:hypothetical protein KDI_54370 [Dictyobacter arantiisoli]|uniref:Uncharacterized protein n=1 Tax=Dictyobacter arantiisoli TaxID=2014874 RepID=A0A5A5TLB6_9CHLR|nr:hypothetical protein KDI_54370 [Dictyobacter arantiisoli]